MIQLRHLLKVLNPIEAIEGCWSVLDVLVSLIRILHTYTYVYAHNTQRGLYYLKRMYLTQNHTYSIKTRVTIDPKPRPIKNEYWSILLSIHLLIRWAHLNTLPYAYTVRKRTHICARTAAGPVQKATFTVLTIWFYCDFTVETMPFESKEQGLDSLNSDQTIQKSWVMRH